MTTKGIKNFLINLLVFLIPTQLAYHFWPSFSFIFGIRVDYLAPTIYLTDILVFVLLFLSLRDVWNFVVQKRKIFYFLILFGLINTFFSINFQITLIKWLKIFEMILFGILIYLYKTEYGSWRIVRTLFYSALVFGMIGVIQFAFGSTLYPKLYLLGERSFNVSTPGIALIQIFGENYLRAYSTFPHPNALAGFLGVVLMLFTGEEYYQRKIFTIGIVLIFISFFLTFSFSAFLAFLVSSTFFVNFLKNKNLLIHLYYYLIVGESLLTPIFALKILPLAVFFGSKFSERIDFAFIAGEIISKNFFIGQGANTYILSVPTYKGLLTYSWILQPVHNIFLLAFSETGIVGLLILFLFFYKKLLKNSRVMIAVFIFVVTTGFFDHYWLTLQQDMLTLALLAGLTL